MNEATYKKLARDVHTKSPSLPAIASVTVSLRYPIQSIMFLNVCSS